jgi:SAM-dependent methyltransferase
MGMGLAVERLSSGGWVPPWVRHQHATRYEWVANFTRNRQVIDAACGTGHGAWTLAKGGARSVDGFDLSTEAIGAAQEQYQASGLCFHVGDVTRLPVPDHAYDVFVSLETIEHLPDDQAFLREVVRVLRPGGTFICSTPNRALTNPGKSLRDRPFNPYHLREYTQPELEALLGLFFTAQDWYGQSGFGTRYQAVLTAVGRWFPPLAVKLHQVRKLLGIPWEKPARHVPARMPSGRVPEILIAVCGGQIAGAQQW